MRTSSELKHNNLKEYIAWKNIKDRCYNPKHPDYWNYGAKGITLCNRWQTFESFLNDIGSAPSATHSIHRLDNNKGYEPGNVEWATKDVQSQIRSFSVFTPALVIHARRLRKQGYTLKQISEAIGIHKNTVGDVVRYRTWNNIPDIPPCIVAKTWKELILIYNSRRYTDE